MIQTKLNWMDLLPIEDDRAILSQARDIEEKRNNLQAQHRILAVRYTSGKHIVSDGTKRTLAYMLEGRIEIPAIVLESDGDFEFRSCFLFESRNPPIRTLKRMYQIYEREIMSEVVSSGVRNFADYTLFKKLCGRKLK